VELVFGLNLYRLKPVYTTNGCSRIYQLLGILKGYAITRIDLKPSKWRKFINANGLLYSKRLIFGGDGTGNHPISRISLCSRRHGLS
jgi:hypothetical protein